MVDSQGLYERYQAGALGFEGVNLRGANLGAVDLSHASLRHADPQGAHLADARLHLAPQGFESHGARR